MTSYTIGMKPKGNKHYSTAHDVLEEMQMQKWFTDKKLAVDVCREAEVLLKGYFFTVFELVKIDVEDRHF